MKVANALPAYQTGRWTYEFFTHFTGALTLDAWTTVLTDSGTALVTDAAGGVVSVVPSDGTVADNDESYVRSTGEVLLVAQNKPIRVYFNAQFTEANTDDANVFLGMGSAIAADFLVDNGAGVRTTGNWFGWYKVDGGTTWQVGSRNGTEVETTDTTITAGGSAYHTHGIEINPLGDGASEVIVTFLYDEMVVKNPSFPERPLFHRINVASSTEMHFGAGVKNGGANNEALKLDWCWVAQGLRS